MKKILLVLTVALIANLLFAVGAFASTTDLNTIPIPQTKELGQWEWDLRVFLNDDIEKGRFFSNALYGVVWDKLEVGFDWNINRPIGPFKMGAKYQVWDEIRDGDVIGLAIGVENIQGTKGRGMDDPQPYIVISKQLNPNIAGYFGVIQYDSEDVNFFAGADWKNEVWQFRVDYLGFDENNERIVSGGIEYQWVKHVDLAGWLSWNSVSEDTTIVLELGFDADFTDITKDGGSV
ncbi:MAG: hypothetical protein ABIG42_03850 [bacterium]